MIDVAFQSRFWFAEPLRIDDERNDYLRDKCRILHSAAFRRLQAKTQVMGVGEGDYHRTRLTHSIEAAQIGEGIVIHLRRKHDETTDIGKWLPTNDLIAAACYAHDLGHPPFGHGGERALHRKMVQHGGFEGNGQTLRILTRLERYHRNNGINPTRRLFLAVLKYPKPYSSYSQKTYSDKPPKCYFDEEKDIVGWALDAPFEINESKIFQLETQSNGRPKHRSLDCSILELADDIAYGVHDIEDIIARKLATPADIVEKLSNVFKNFGTNSALISGESSKGVSIEEFREKLNGESWKRKELMGKLVNLFVTSVKIKQEPSFTHPILRYRAFLDHELEELLGALKLACFELVINRAQVQQLEFRGQVIVDKLFEAFESHPEKLIPKSSWEYLDFEQNTNRRVCDYIAGMTDPYAERIYKRLFVPGTGSSYDEI